MVLAGVENHEDETRPSADPTRRLVSADPRSSGMGVALLSTELRAERRRFAETPRSSNSGSSGRRWPGELLLPGASTRAVGEAAQSFPGSFVGIPGLRRGDDQPSVAYPYTFPDGDWRSHPSRSATRGLRGLRHPTCQQDARWSASAFLKRRRRSALPAGRREGGHPVAADRAAEVSGDARPDPAFRHEAQAHTGDSRRWQDAGPRRCPRIRACSTRNPAPTPKPGAQRRAGGDQQASSRQWRGVGPSVDTVGDKLREVFATGDPSIR